MTILDFKEIAQANKSTGMQDEFELFCRDFFNYLGYEIISEPDRGQDGGLDLLIQETRVGIGGKDTFRWLVSCKHNAHSATGKAVGIEDEIDIVGRVRAHGCGGFIGIYSTIASSSLNRKLKGLADNEKIEFKIFNRGTIEEALFREKRGINIARRFFPESTKDWLNTDRSSAGRVSENLIETRSSFYEDYVRRKKKKKY